MDLYKKMYFKLFNCVTTSDIEAIKEILKNAQIETEEMYIEGEED